MLGIGIVVAQLGYWIAYYGFDLLTGGNDSFLDLGVPGRWKGTPAPRDGGGPAPSSGPGATGQPPPGTPTTTVPLPGGGTAPGGVVGAPNIGANGDVGAPIPGSVLG